MPSTASSACALGQGYARKRTTYGLTASRRPSAPPARTSPTKIGEIVATVGQFQDAELSNRLGNVVSQAGNSIAEQAQAKVRFEWTPHELTN
jgi:hypothetical protein